MDSPKSKFKTFIPMVIVYKEGDDPFGDNVYRVSIKKDGTIDMCEDADGVTIHDEELMALCDAVNILKGQK